MGHIPAGEHTLVQMTLINTSFSAVVTVSADNSYLKLSVLSSSNIMFSDSILEELVHKL